MSRTIAESPENSALIPIEKLGLPGVLTSLNVVPIFKDSNRSDQERLEDTTARKFHVTCRLAKTIESKPNINFNFSEDSGDSLFALPENAIHFKVETTDGQQFFLHANAERRLSSIRFDCVARSNAEARGLFQRTVGPALDHLSFVANTPLHTAQISIFDELHLITSTELLCPHPIVTLSPGMGKVSAILAPVYAMYREAKNSASPFYTFFCLYKILEGVLKKLKARVYEEAKIKGIAIPPFQPKVPSYPDMTDDQKAYVGKSITRFFEEFLTTRYRNSMAHFISDEGAVLNVNEMAGIERYHGVIHITDLCCREVISHFESCINALEKNISP